MVELMISVAVGLTVLAGVTTMLVDSLRANNDTIRASRLNQELRAVMSLVVGELRRAGYRGDYANYIGLLAAGQTFSNTVTVSDGGAQVNLSYDLDGDGAFSTAEAFGFRLVDQKVQALRNGAWLDLTDPGQSLITTLSFCFWPAADGTCLDAPPDASKVTIPDGAAQVVVKDLRITLTGESAQDATIVRTLRETVRVRNDEVVNPAATP